MYNVQSTDYGVSVTGNYWGHLDCQVLRAPRYLKPALRPHQHHGLAHNTLLCTGSGSGSFVNRKTQTENSASLT